jgi:tetratricopeptide (TPR) repeat protein
MSRIFINAVMRKNVLIMRKKNFLKMRSIIVVLLVLFASTFTAKAQLFDRLSNPQITINVVHPPTIGLKVNKIAFGPAFGRCSDQIINDIMSDFVSNQIEVINQESFSNIMREHHFNNSGFANQATAASMGKILGPSALLFVKVLRCATQQDKLTGNVERYDSKTKQRYTVKVYYSKTRAFLKASIQTVDLATGRTFAAQTFDFSPERVNQSEQGFPEFPADFDVQDMAYKMLSREVHRMFIPWNELMTLYFYDDNENGLKQAYQALKANDLEQSFILSQQALEKCKTTPGVKDKIMGHAYYNMGMCHMLRNEYDKALDYLRESGKFRPGGILNETIAGCIKQRDLAMAMQQIDDKANFEADKSQKQEEDAYQAEAQNTLINADIISLTKQKLSKALILQKIKTSKCKFDTSAKALVALQNAGVNEDVISLMMEKTN